MSTLKEFLAAAQSRGDRFYLFSQTEQRLFSLDEMIRLECVQWEPTPDTPSLLPLMNEALTEREEQIITMVQAGNSYLAIAKELLISLGTVKKTVYNAYRKLGVHSRWELIRKSSTTESKPSETMK